MRSDIRNDMPQPHVLFVEDEAFILLSVAERLSEAGLTVTAACSAEGALDLLRERHRFDLLLTDIHMPGRFSGVDVACHVRSLWPEVPVIFATGRPDAMCMFGALGPRDRCILKPYRPTEVLAAIQCSLALDMLACERQLPSGTHRPPL